MDSTTTDNSTNIPVTDGETATTAPAVTKENLVVTNTGVDLTASDTGVNPQAEEAKKNNPNMNVATEALLAADPTPGEEAAMQLPADEKEREAMKLENRGNPTPAQSNPVGMPIDASGIGVTTNQDVIDNFPKNDQGQVVINEEGKIEGLSDENQPRQASGSQE
jgi:hypothetical protein